MSCFPERIAVSYDTESGQHSVLGSLSLYRALITSQGKTTFSSPKNPDPGFHPPSCLMDARALFLQPNTEFNNACSYVHITYLNCALFG
jgi:hypothetical protein